MAKLFYTLEEAAAKLGKSTDEVMNMAKAGQLQELRNKDQVLFRRSAIDQLAGDSDSGSELNLDAIELAPGEDALQLSGTDLAGDGLSLEETGLNLSTDELRLDDDVRAFFAGATPEPAAPIAASGAEDSMMLEELTLADDEPAPAKQPAPPMSPAASASGLAERSAIGLADSSAGSVAGGAAGSMAGSAAGSMAGSAAGSRILTGSGAPLGNDDSMMMGAMGQSVEAVGSGSGLLDMTRDAADESSAGLQLFEEVSADESAPNAASGLFADVGAGTEGEADAPAAAIGAFGVGAAVVPEEVSGAWSGATVGLMLGAAACLVICLVIAIGTSLGGTPTLTTMIKGDMMMWVGGLAGAVVVFGVAGFFIGKATE